MQLSDKIKTLGSSFSPSKGEDLDQMIEDIYHYFSELEDFEVLRIQATGKSDRMVLAACLTTMQDPFFKIVVSHTWQTDLAYDDQWSEFENHNEFSIFRFLTWNDDAYISGEIWFERAKIETI